MNKKLLALAVAGACVAPTAMAQTANPVTLYGRIYLTVENVEADAAGTTAALAKRTRMQDQASYLGVRGTEDLGGGLKAFFQLETAFNPDDGSGTFANRNSGVGLQGGWGSVLLGRWDTPMKSSMTAVDPYGDLTAGDITGAALDQGNFSRRNGNLVQYWSPNMGGFAVKLAHMPDEGRTATAKPTVTSASLTYSKGAIYLAAAYEEHKDQLGTTTTAGAKEEGVALAGRVALGKLRLMGHYGEYKKTGSAKDKSYMVGADYAMGKHVLLGSYQNAEAGSADCDMFSIGYRYDFTKRTFFIASYTEVDNSNGMNCNFGTGSFGSAGQDLTAISAGIRHVF
ncbi:MAG TPA: porin [Usitatibacteraceae bacterium]|mgnify:CR=1 FL=1|jgi:predicted porin|nr:porin [Usitatibacteraceae bacterium]